MTHLLVSVAIDFLTITKKKKNIDQTIKHPFSKISLEFLVYISRTLEQRWMVKKYLESFRDQIQINKHGCRTLMHNGACHKTKCQNILRRTRWLCWNDLTTAFTTNSYKISEITWRIRLKMNCQLLWTLLRTAEARRFQRNAVRVSLPACSVVLKPLWKEMTVIKITSIF